MKNLIAVTIGDIDGIGIHLLVKEWVKGNLKNFILITNFKILYNSKIIDKNQINLINSKNEFKKFNNDKINILNINTKNKHTNSIDSLKTAYDYAKNGMFIGILTLPLNKNKINKFANKSFIDQTTYFSKLEKNNITNMVFHYKNKFFIPLTIHIELKNVHNYFKNKKLILNKIISLNKTIKYDFGIKNPKIIMSGINPHAGENGLISNDDNQYIKPIINFLKKNNININGPYSGDGVINKKNLRNYDVFIFTYHDQALIPFKIISNYEGVNFTSNLKIIRVSPSHGTAVDMIGKKDVNTKSIINCFKILKKIYKNRNK